MPRRAPWLQPVGQRESNRDRHVRVWEGVLSLVVVAALVALIVWALFVASGGMGPGSV